MTTVFSGRQDAALYVRQGCLTLRRREGFFEDGLEEVGGVGARLRDFAGQRADAALQRRHSRHDRRLLGQRWERDEC